MCVLNTCGLLLFSMKFVNFFLKWIFASLLRLFRFFPNNDPIIGLALPSAKKSPLFSIVFVLVAMVSFDFITQKLGVWTLVTAVSYVFIVFLLSKWFVSLKKVKFKHYFLGSVVGILIFDAVTGPGMSTFIFHQSFLVSLLGQIPFTLYHLASGVSYSLFFAVLFDPNVQAEVFASVMGFRFFAPVELFFKHFNALVA